MSQRTKRTIRAYDTDVRMRRPIVAALLCLVTGGIWGAVHHFRLSSELQRYGRARGAMPFAFTPVAPGASTLAWVAGLAAWYGVVGATIAYLAWLGDGAQPSAEDITTAVSLLLMLAPLWLVAIHTMRRIRTAQHLAGATGPYPSPLRSALLLAAFPPLGTWNAQRQLNRAWRVYADAGSGSVS
jgi:hypothetical protein